MSDRDNIAELISAWEGTHPDKALLMADSILASDWLAGVKVDVWDECLAAIDSNELNTAQARQGNPYRTIPSTDVESDGTAVVCPECGRHLIGGGDRPISHAEWLRFTEWMAEQTPANAVPETDVDHG